MDNAVGVSLVREGDKAVVLVHMESGDAYRAIVEPIDGNFSHYRSLAWQVWPRESDRETPLR